jgi:D-glycerate 3-kinase
MLKCIFAREGEKIPVPFYDKSLCGGRGDRASRERWPVVEGPVDVILLEGWMLGFRPLPSGGEERGRREEGLKDVNHYLGKYEKWHELVDAWVVVQVEEVEVIYKWRLEAERRMREEKGKEGSMTDVEVADFVSRFLPAYEAYLQPSLYAADALPPEKPVLRVLIDRDRKPKG